MLIVFEEFGCSNTNIYSFPLECYLDHRHMNHLKTVLFNFQVFEDIFFPIAFLHIHIVSILIRAHFGII